MSVETMTGSMTMSDTPIFDSLSSKYLRSGKRLPWFATIGTYKGSPVTIFPLSKTTTGIYPQYTDNYIRNIECKDDNCKICDFFG